MLNISAELCLIRPLALQLKEPLVLDDDNPTLFRVDRVDNHSLGHGSAFFWSVLRDRAAKQEFGAQFEERKKMPGV